MYKTHFYVCKTSLTFPSVVRICEESHTPLQLGHKHQKCSTSKALYVSDSDREARRQRGQIRFGDGADRRCALWCATRCRSHAAFLALRTSTVGDHKSHGSLTEMRATGNKIRVLQTVHLALNFSFRYIHILIIITHTLTHTQIRVLAYIQLLGTC